MEEVKIFSNMDDNVAVDYKADTTIAIGNILMYGATGWYVATGLALDEALNLGKVGMAVAPSNDLKIPMGAARSAPGETADPPTAVTWGKGAIVFFTSNFEAHNLPAASFQSTGSEGDRLALTAGGLFYTLTSAADHRTCVAIALEDFDASSGLTYKITTVGAGYIVPKPI